jgi:hypothetical protein
VVGILTSTLSVLRVSKQGSKQASKIQQYRFAVADNTVEFATIGRIEKFLDLNHLQAKLDSHN